MCCNFFYDNKSIKYGYKRSVDIYYKLSNDGIGTFVKIIEVCEKIRLMVKFFL
jgi:hypothetical protein